MAEVPHDKEQKKEEQVSDKPEQDKEEEPEAESKDVEVIELAPDEELVEEGEEDEYEDFPDEEDKGKPEGEEKAEPREMNNTNQLLGHKDFVTSVCFCPTNTGLLATGSGDETSKVWSLSTHKELGTLSGHKDTVTACKFSFDGKRLCTASMDNTLKIWKTQEPFELMGTLDGPQDEIHFIQWHHKGNVVLCGAEDGSMWMYDGNKCEYMNTFTGHHGAVRAGGFTTDGKCVYSAGLDGTLRLWQPKKPGGEPEILKSAVKLDQIGGYTCACCHPTKPLILAGSDIGTMVVALYATHKIGGTMRMSGRETYIETVAASAVCDNFVACGTNDGDFHVVDITVPKIRNSNTLNEPIVKSIFSKKDETVYVGTAEGKIYRIDPRSGNVVHEYIGPACSILDFEISA